MNLCTIVLIFQLFNDSTKSQQCLNSKQKSVIDFRKKRPLIFPCKNDSYEVSIRKSLELWKAEVEKSSLSSFYQGPIDKHDFQLDISLNMLKSNPNFNMVGVVIESAHGEILFQGTMKNGHLYSRIHLMPHNISEWKTRLNIKLHKQRNVSKTILTIKGSLNNGKLHGLIQMYGILTRNPDDACSESTFDGLSFIGRYENGKPIGICWRQLVGGSWLYGQVDKEGNFSGDEIAYIYQDFDLAVIGHYKKGILVGVNQELEIIIHSYSYPLKN